MTAVAFVLLIMAHVAALSDFTLRHRRPNRIFDVSFPIDRMRRMAFAPLLLRPFLIFFRFGFGKLAQMASTASDPVRHDQIFGVIDGIFTDSAMTVDTTDLVELLAFVEQA